MTDITRKDIEALQEGGALLASILQSVVAKVEPGITTAALDRHARALIEKHGAHPSFLGYRGYPASLCTSVNSNIVHGIPSETEVLHEGDIIGLDIGIKYKNRITDMAVTVPVGTIMPEAAKLLTVCEESLARAIAFVKPGIRTGDLGAHIQRYIEEQGFGVIRDLVGHGVGKKVHEEPMIPNFGTPGTGEPLEAGMVIAIEPMITAGDWHVRTHDDGWTVETSDGSLGAHFEHTIAVTNDGIILFTQTHGDHPWP